MLKKNFTWYRTEYMYIGLRAGLVLFIQTPSDGGSVDSVMNRSTVVRESSTDGCGSTELRPITLSTPPADAPKQSSHVQCTMQ